MAHRALERAEVDKALSELNSPLADGKLHWTLAGGKLHKEFRFRDFVQAFGFMSQAALVAERMNHHPEWFNVYQTVRVDLATHDVNGISERDFALARAMNEIAAATAKK